MKRLCVFAHWDKDKLIDDYVIYYIKELKKVCEYIIFVSDCNLNSDETEKLNGIADYVIAKRHGEYDFGSYKRGFLYAKEKGLDFEELLFVNDSCYGPFLPLEPIFEKMSQKTCDFWGMTKNICGMKKQDDEYIGTFNPHIQSYFILFKKNLFESDIFNNFITNIKTQNNKCDVVANYEVGLSKLLYSNGFKSASYIEKYDAIGNCTTALWDKIIIKDHFPFLKTTLLRSRFYMNPSKKPWEKVIKKVSDYPISLIENHNKRMSERYDDAFERMNIYRQIRHKLLLGKSINLRKFIVKLEKNTFNFLNVICFNKLKKF